MELWSTGITVKYGYGGTRKGEEYSGWWAELKWTSGGFCTPGTMEGDIHTRYAEATMSEAIDYVVAVADRFGITQGPTGAPFHLYYETDGENPDWPPPDGWRAMLQEEAKRRGWGTYDMWILSKNPG